MHSDPHPDAVGSSEGAWLRMEGPTSPMVAVAVLVTAGPLTFARLKELVEDRLMAHRRFRQRVVESRLPLRGARWVESDDFALAHQVCRTELPEPGDEEALEKLVGGLAGRPLDRDHPLWRIHFLERYGRGSAIVALAHPCLGDGTALLRILLELVDPAAGGDAQAPPSLEQGFGSLLDPSDVRAAAAESGWGVRMLARLVTLRSDPPSPLRGRLGTDKRVAWSRPKQLAAIRSAARRHGATLDAVVLAAVSAALGRYLEQRGGRAPEAGLRAVVPLDLRGPDDNNLGIRFGLATVTLPVGSGSLSGRIRAISAELGRIAQSPEEVVGFGLPETPSMSAEIEDRLVNHIGRKVSLMLALGPGPAEPVRVGGAKLAELIYWLPQSARLGLGLNVSSYAGSLRLAVSADGGLVPDPARLTEAFEEAIEELQK